MAFTALVVSAAITGYVLATLAYILLLMPLMGGGGTSVVEVLFFAGSTSALMMGIVFLALAYHRLRSRTARLQTRLAIKGESYQNKERDLVKLVQIQSEISTYYVKMSQLLFEMRTTREGAADVLPVAVRQTSMWLVDRTAEVFSTQTGGRCAVSIKLLRGGPFEAASSADFNSIPLIQTYSRDTASYFDRHFIDDDMRFYKYDGNTAFRTILESAEIGDFFYSNDLRALAKSGRYVNGNPDWPKLYNATVVAPIRDPSSKHGHTIGFLCVDNFVGNFDTDTCRHLMKQLSGMLYSILREGSFVQYNLRPSQVKTIDFVDWTPGWMKLLGNNRGDSELSYSEVQKPFEQVLESLEFRSVHNPEGVTRHSRKQGAADTPSMHEGDVMVDPESRPEEENFFGEHTSTPDEIELRSRLRKRRLSLTYEGFLADLDEASPNNPLVRRLVERFKAET